tara:strand:+ start:386 stop:613 length:228 start_codon:yes stop_codon:yes gene_type:complete
MSIKVKKVEKIKKNKFNLLKFLNIIKHIHIDKKALIIFSSSNFIFINLGGTKETFNLGVTPVSINHIVKVLSSLL